MKVAICISGHVRSLDKCIQNIRENIFYPIKSEFDTDIFLSTWSTDKDLSFLNEDSVTIEVEPTIDFRMNSKNYLKYPNLCCQTTCDNATSMWYKVKKSFDMTNDEHQIIVRIRPDVIYDTKIDLSQIIDSYSNDNIYMSNSPGRYLEVTKGMLDPFIFGNRKVMSNLMNTYNNIEEYVKDDNIVHCIEGFLYENTKNNKLERIDFKYSILRENGSIDKLY